ncbi:hypothetical protein F2Q68_00024163 [Brassica cretica]|uniref:RING-type domain-containing protein n=1 Tax=Brassica cretica TaxID=69181 RepID=A0A8S9IFB4_BRACR|nr:hypothetical protein F2Q68_00024163 [Brassica cretica]
MKEGGGHALFTAECSHSFHFHCIASNVKHGNQVCPVCRAKWKEIPMQHPPYLLHPLPTPRRVMNQGRGQPPEPSMFNDDEPLEQQLAFPGKSLKKMMELKIHPEVSSVPRAESREKFDVLVQLRAAGMMMHGSPSADVSSMGHLANAVSCSIYGFDHSCDHHSSVMESTQRQVLLSIYSMAMSISPCGLAGLSAGLAIGIVGDAGVSECTATKALCGMILILIFAEALSLYGLIVAVEGEHFTAKGIGMESTAGPEGGQAVALRTHL